MCGVRGRIFHELEVLIVFNALIPYLDLYSWFIPVESRARSID